VRRLGCGEEPAGLIRPERGLQHLETVQGRRTINKSGGKTGGEAGIRTLGTTFRSYNGLANRRLQPLGHLTVSKTLGNLRISVELLSCESPTVPKTVPRPGKAATSAGTVVSNHYSGQTLAWHVSLRCFLGGRQK
jgi:hypothetical protein